MKQFIAKKTCFWGPQQGTESVYQKGDVILAHGTEPNLDEFFEAVKPEPALEPVMKPKGGKKSAPLAEDDL